MPKRRSAAQARASKANLAKARAAKKRTGSENTRLNTARGEYRTKGAVAKPNTPLGRQAHLQSKIFAATKTGSANLVSSLQRQQRAGQRDTSHGGYEGYVAHKKTVQGQAIAAAKKEGRSKRASAAATRRAYASVSDADFMAIMKGQKAPKPSRRS